MNFFPLILVLLFIVGIAVLAFWTYKLRTQAYARSLAELDFSPFSSASEIPEDAEVFHRGSRSDVLGLWKKEIAGWSVLLSDIRYLIDKHHQGIQSFRTYVLVFRAVDSQLKLPYFRILSRRMLLDFVTNHEGEHGRANNEVRVNLESGRMVVTLPGLQSRIKMLLGADVQELLSTSRHTLCVQAHNRWIAIWPELRRPRPSELQEFFENALKLARTIRASARR